MMAQRNTWICSMVLALALGAALGGEAPTAKDDKALKMADDLLHGIKNSASAAPTPGTEKTAADKPKAAN